jgi:hypothetical protein
MTVLQINSMLAKNYFVPRHISFLGQYEIYLKNAARIKLSYVNSMRFIKYIIAV